ncbi:MAG: ribosome-associated translation inhibitor RaiA [Mycolicibacterium sp.]|uniref:ribosome hibernation-promoting factor, HPF/YfiA family n=1 Tax=Mycolicibacterium sp. TaxID=2320850 RepID=UPI003D14AC9B
MSINSADTDSTMVVDESSAATASDANPNAEVVVKGRNVEVPDHFRTHVAEKLARLERFDRTIYLFDVELDHEKNRRQRKNCQHVEITARGRGPVVRGEACADTFYGALEAAVDKLESRLRKSKDRRKIHYGDKTPLSLHEATSLEHLADAFKLPEQTSGDGGAPIDGSAPADTVAVAVDDHEPGRIVRTKEHPAIPMTVDDALYEMELVGHDFFLFHDKESDKPCVVYRRHAYDYGMIRLA